MSTFGGYMPEFPDIRVDYFRRISGLNPPLACFLSHVHSDHLAGLETLKSPFVYCSAATKELLLRLERYPHRLNFALGILESHKQQYKHLKALLKAIPLETPTVIELEPQNKIQVTLFDANHCTGAVMFLIENDSKAILYTGDIRSEPWFVNSLVRNPFLIEYASGLKSLDCIYLDTSNTGPTKFPTKADGLKELLQKVAKYPPDTVFHFAAWTFGYEEVWMALSRALKSPIHVDKYKLRLYHSLRGESDRAQPSSIISHNGPALAGYKCGNIPQGGCLTDDINVRIHSCEKGMHCETINDKTVWIRPIIARSKDGSEISETGIGGGGSDLTRRPELELDSDYIIEQFLSLFGNAEHAILQDVRQTLLQGLRTAAGSLSLDDMELDRDDDISLQDLTKIFIRSMADRRSKSLTDSPEDNVREEALPRIITFPYSRHSSYEELCDLVKAFNPKDVYPCTVDEKNWHEGNSMENLFGGLCSKAVFRHDKIMRSLHEDRQSISVSQQSQTTERTQSSQMEPIESPQRPLGLSLRRNSDGKLLIFDAEGNECLPVSKTVSASTPPREILAVSPGSESQGLRRKAIQDSMDQSQFKRVRASYDGNVSLVPEAANEDMTSQKASFPTNDASSTTAATTVLNPAVSADENDTPSTDKHSCDPEISNSPCWDANEEVFRCVCCGFEVLTPRGGCKCNYKEEVSYLEVLIPEQGTRPGIVQNEFDLRDDMSADEREELVGDYMDFDSSAYDSQDDEARKKDEEYEKNSFINDSDDGDHSEEEGDESSSDGETDYKEKYRELQETHQSLVTDYCALADQHEELKREFFGSDYEEDDIDEDGMLMVDVAVPDPVLTEVVVSHARGESQESELSAGRIRHRAEAFEAALDGHNWHNISLISTGDNHTFEEVEL